MRVEFILLAVAFVYLAYKLGTHYINKQRGNNFKTLEDKEENLFLYMSEMHQLCGKHINAENQIENLDDILNGVSGAGFEILKFIPVDETKAVLFTRVVADTTVEDSIVNYETDVENDYLITFDKEKSELIITSTIFTNLDDKIEKNDFARVFISHYRNKK